MSFRTGRRKDNTSYKYPISADSGYVPKELNVHKIELELQEPWKMMLHGMEYDDATEDMKEIYATKSFLEVGTINPRIKQIPTYQFGVKVLNPEDRINNWQYEYANFIRSPETADTFITYDAKNDKMYIIVSDIVDGHEAITYFTRDRDLENYVYIMPYKAKNTIWMYGGTFGIDPKTDYFNQYATIDRLYNLSLVDEDTTVEVNTNTQGNSWDIPREPKTMEGKTLDVLHWLEEKIKTTPEMKR